MLKLSENIDGSIDIIDNDLIIDNISPNYDLDKSINLLKTFNNSIIENQKLYEFWSVDNFYILPALQEWIFWDYFVPLVKYSELFAKYDLNMIDFKKSSTIEGLIGLNKYKRIIGKQPNIFLRIVKKLLIHILQFLNPVNNILVFDDGMDGFRYKKIKEVFKNKIRYSRIHLLTKKDIFNLFYRKVFYFGFIDIFHKRNNKLLDNFKNFSKIDSHGFNNLIHNIDIKCNEIINSVSHSKKLLKKNKIIKIYGYDQIELIIPLVIAAKSLNIKIITHQHGVISKYHAGWMAPGIPIKYCNIKSDKLVVWGELWKNVMLKHSTKYLEDDIIIGKHLNKDMKLPVERKSNENSNQQKKSLSLLYPYEFMANQKSVALFLNKFIKFGANITIKVRNPSANDIAAGNIAKDSLAYDAELRSKISFTYDLSDKEILQSFDAIICTQSTYALEMMKLNMPIWYLETDFNYMDFIINENIAHKISVDNFDLLFGDNKEYKDLLSPLYDNKIYSKIFNQDNSDQLIINEIIR